VGYKVVHCGTGNIGAVALKAILQHPDLELVGHYVSTPAKAGCDSGELVGLPRAGVTATAEWADLYDIGADCITYFGNSIGRERDAVSDLVPFLERGTNAVTFSGFEIAHPATAPAELREPIDAACRTGNSTCYFTGIDPGWATTDLAIASLAAANRVDCIRVLELGWWGDYTAEFVCREYAPILGSWPARVSLIACFAVVRTVNYYGGGTRRERIGGTGHASTRCEHTCRDSCGDSGRGADRRHRAGSGGRAERGWRNSPWVRPGLSTL
jgi:hypothetical protein